MAVWEGFLPQMEAAQASAGQGSVQGAQRTPSLGFLVCSLWLTVPQSHSCREEERPSKYLGLCVCVCGGGLLESVEWLQNLGEGGTISLGGQKEIDRHLDMCDL